MGYTEAMKFLKYNRVYRRMKVMYRKNLETQQSKLYAIETYR